MYTPISCEFFDQLNVAMKRNIPSTIVYLQNNEKKKHEISVLFHIFYTDF